MGWRYTLLCLGALCLVIFFLRFVVFDFQESPKYLLYRNKDEKAVKVLHHIAKFNGRESGITVETFQTLDKEDRYNSSGVASDPTLEDEALERKKTWKELVKLEFIRYKILFSTFTMARLTILIWITCKQCSNFPLSCGLASWRQVRENPCNSTKPRAMAK